MVILISQKPHFFFDLLRSTALTGQSWLDLCSSVSTHCLIRADGVDLGPEHDASEEREEKTFKHSKQGEDEGKRTGHYGVATLKVLTDTSEEEPRHHYKTKHRHRHDVELKGINRKVIYPIMPNESMHGYSIILFHLGY